MDIPVELSRILITEHGDQQVIFLKEKDGDRSFPILIGIAEALAIDRRLKDRPTPRPMTHDLLAGVIEALGAEIQKIVITDIRDHTFIAMLHLACNGNVVQVDSRPSDAIALGVAFDTPIFVAEHVIDAVLNTAGPSKEWRIGLLRRRMEMLRQRISEVNEKLDDEDFLAATPPEIIAAHRKRLKEMTEEHDAIEHVLKKLT